jgi:hypothetical protein
LLGLVVFRFLYSLPKQPNLFYYKDWFKILTKAIYKCEPEDLVDFLREYILKIQTKERLSASNCLEAGSRLFEVTLSTSTSDNETEVITPTKDTGSNLRAIEAPIDYPLFGDLPPTQRGFLDNKERYKEEDADEEEEEWLLEERTVQMSVNRKDVSIHISDYWLNTAQIQAGDNSMPSTQKGDKDLDIDK